MDEQTIKKIEELNKLYEINTATLEQRISTMISESPHNNEDISLIVNDKMRIRFGFPPGAYRSKALTAVMPKVLNPVDVLYADICTEVGIQTIHAGRPLNTNLFVRRIFSEVIKVNSILYNSELTPIYRRELAKLYRREQGKV